METEFQRKFAKEGMQWDPFNMTIWSDKSNALATRYSDYFLEWWDEDKFKGNPYVLMTHCLEHFEVWWPYNKNMISLGFYELSLFCGEYLNIWWPDIEMEWNIKNASYLEKYCSKHKRIWLADYVVWKLSNE